MSEIEDVLEIVDMVLVMSVEPGFGGQGYLDSADEKIRELAKKLGEGVDLSVDGGIKIDNVEKVVLLGANTIVAGSAIFGADDIEAQTKKFVDLVEKAEAERLGKA